MIALTFISIDQVRHNEAQYPAYDRIGDRRQTLRMSPHLNRADLSGDTPANCTKSRSMDNESEVHCVGNEIESSFSGETTSDSDSDKESAVNTQTDKQQSSSP